MKLDLNGIWQVKNLTDDTPAFSGSVPSTNFNDLLRNSLIPDPFVKMNEKDTLWVGDKDWIYSRTFIISKEILAYDRVDLVAECLDTIADIFINDKILSSTRNAHVGYRFSLKNFLNVGENTIKIVFKSPNCYIKEESERIGYAFGTGR